MAILTQEAKTGAKDIGRGLKGVGKAAAVGTGRTVKKHPTISALVGGYAAGAYASKNVNYTSSHPEFYDRTPNKGRAEDKHPYG